MLQRVGIFVPGQQLSIMLLFITWSNNTNCMLSLRNLQLVFTGMLKLCLHLYWTCDWTVSCLNTETRGKSKLTKGCIAVRTNRAAANVYNGCVGPWPNTWFFGSLESTTQTASRSVQNRQRPHYIDSKRLHLMLCIVMWPSR